MTQSGFRLATVLVASSLLMTGLLTAETVFAQAAVAPAPAITVREASSTVPAQPGIKVLPVTQLPSATVGVLSQKEGGFSADLWQNSQAVRMRQLYESLPANVQSPALRDIIVRLLLTPTGLPADAAADPSIAQAIQQARLNRLISLEAFDELERLLPAIPKNGRDGYWFEAHFRTFLYQQDFERACGVVDTASALQDVFWQQARLFCQGVRKDFDGALRTVALMKEQGQPVPEWLQRLVISMAREAAPETMDANAAEEPAPSPVPQHMVFPHLGAVELGMLAAWPAAEDDHVQAGGLTPEAGKLYRLMATHSNLPWETRLQAGEMALATGHFDALALQALYQQVPFSEQELTIKPGDNAEKSAWRRAQWFRALSRLYTVEDSVAAMSAVFAHYHEMGMMRVATGLYGNTVRDLSRAIFRKHPFAAFAPDAFSVLFAERHFADARLWLDAASMGDKPVVQAVPVWEALLTALMPLADEQQAVPAGTPVAIDMSDYRQEAFWVRGGLMLEALGMKLPENYWQVVPAQNRGALSVQGQMIRQAATANKRGEVLIMAVQMAAGQTRLSDMDAATLIQALVQQNFRHEALQITQELLMQELMGQMNADKLVVTSIPGEKHAPPPKPAAVEPSPAPAATAVEPSAPAQAEEATAPVKKPRKKIKKTPPAATPAPPVKKTPAKTAPKVSVPTISLPSTDVGTSKK
ncbi:hypothetical protein GC177_05155 [bacterium]|nr:hypothetical protein [bacterium]